MQDFTKTPFIDKIPNTQMLLDYGFTTTGDGCYTIKKQLSNALVLSLTVDVLKNTTDVIVIDGATGETFTLFKAAAAKGAFVTAAREEVATLCKEIALKCFTHKPFTSAMLVRLLDYCKATYGVAPEYLWDKFPNYAILRNDKTKKWFAVIVTLDHSKLTLPEGVVRKKTRTGTVEALILHAPKDVVMRTAGTLAHYCGYHMNKKYWFTVVPEESNNFNLMQLELDRSFLLSQEA